ncbi:MAG: dihydroorotate dehydrogenase, partial [Oscillospiraceae bacterium]|nr:dihydroorotate dehydrogenase [Oscillospiraceae bacterium]
MKMIEMSVNLAGVTLKNPVITASGTCGYGKEYSPYYMPGEIGAITVKALTVEPRLGNETPRIAETPSGILNAIGLQNPGVEYFIEHELPRLKKLKAVVIANIAGRTIEEYCAAAEMLDAAGVDMIELNISCPNVEKKVIGTFPKETEEYTKAVKKIVTKPLIVKLTPNVTDITEIAKAAESGGADCLSLINTILGMRIDINKRRPILGNITGGLSGPAIFPVAVRMVYQVSKAVNLPIIGMGGISSGDDA